MTKACSGRRGVTGTPFLGKRGAELPRRQRGTWKESGKCKPPVYAGSLGHSWKGGRLDVLLALS